MIDSHPMIDFDEGKTRKPVKEVPIETPINKIESDEDMFEDFNKIVVVNNKIESSTSTDSNETDPITSDESHDDVKIIPMVVSPTSSPPATRSKVPKVEIPKAKKWPVNQAYAVDPNVTVKYYGSQRIVVRNRSSKSSKKSSISPKSPRLSPRH